jgi:hypothetical protein
MVLQSIFDIEPRGEIFGIFLVEGTSMGGVGCFSFICFDGQRMMTCRHDLDDDEKGNDDMILASIYTYDNGRITNSGNVDLQGCVPSLTF